MLDIFPPMGSQENELSVQRFESAAGAQIFQLPLLVFPGLWGFTYLVLVEHEDFPYRVLIDTGSGFGESRVPQNLETAQDDHASGNRRYYMAIL